MVDKLLNIKEISLGGVKNERFGPWAVFMLISVLPFFSMMAYLTTGSLAEKQETDIDGRFMERMEIDANNKARNVERWLGDIVDKTHRITHSRVVQMFVMDVNESELDASFEGPLLQRKLYIEEVLETFRSQQAFETVYLANRRAQVFTGQNDSSVLPSNYNAIVRDVFISRKTVFSPLRMDGEKMLADIYLPIFALKGFEGKQKRSLTVDGEWEETNKVVGVLMATISVKDQLIDLLGLNENKPQGEHLYIFQEVLNGVEMVRFQPEYEGIFSQNKDVHADDIFKQPWKVYYLGAEGKHDLSNVPRFGSQSTTMPKPGEILTIKKSLKDLPLTLMYYLELQEAYQDLLVQRRQLHFIGQLIALLLFVFVLALWWKMQDMRHSALAKQYHKFSEKVNAHRHLLLSINKALKEHVTLKYFDGKYVYANAAFCRFLGLKLEEVLGKTDAQLFGEKIAEDLSDLDKDVLKSKSSITHERSFVFKDKRFHLIVSKSPFLDGNNKFAGITTVIKDVTDVVQARILKERALKSSVKSMMRIMQRHDEHLMRHAKYLRSLVVDFSQRLKLSEEEKTILEICANLSQIGKIYLPKDMLENHHSLEGDELNAYRAYIEDTAYIIDTVDFSLPVVKTVYAMHENLDGSGYPNGLKANEISKLSRILNICDRFAKLVAPRRGQKIHTPEEAIKWMVNQKGKYDLSLLQSFAEMITEDESTILAS